MSISSPAHPKNFVLMGLGEDAGALLAKGARAPATPSCVLGHGAASPVEQQVQHLLGGGEGPVRAQEDGDVGGVIALEG